MRNRPFHSIVLAVVLVLPLIGGPAAAARQELETSPQAWSEKIEAQRDWPSFERELARYRETQGIIGSSYVASGVAVAIGSVVGQQRTTDTASRFVFGVSEGLGLLAIGYGLQVLMTGNEYESFYEAARLTELTPQQRNTFIRAYLEREEERRRITRNIAIGTHLLIAGFNFYSASIEQESGAKNLLAGIGALNLAIAFAYTF